MSNESKDTLRRYGDVFYRGEAKVAVFSNSQEADAYQALLARVTELARMLEAAGKRTPFETSPPRAPSGYAYRYAANWIEGGLLPGVNTVISFERHPDREPIEAVPYWFDSPPTPQPTDDELLDIPDFLRNQENLKAERDAPHSTQHLKRFTQWLEKEMPEGTVIGDPLWWARRLLAAACVTADELPVPPNEQQARCKHGVPANMTCAEGGPCCPLNTGDSQ